MRLTAEQIETVLTRAHEHLGSEVSIAVYGSRLDSRRKGGDLDLFIETTDPVSGLQRAGLKLALEAALNMPVDILVHQRDTPCSAFQALARAKSVDLEAMA